jgi:hypothetical protein
VDRGQKVPRHPQFQVIPVFSEREAVVLQVAVVPTACQVPAIREATTQGERE